MCLPGTGTKERGAEGEGTGARPEDPVFLEDILPHLQ